MWHLHQALPSSITKSGPHYKWKKRPSERREKTQRTTLVCCLRKFLIIRRKEGKQDPGFHFTANIPTTVQAIAMRAAMSDSPAINPEATGT